MLALHGGEVAAGGMGITWNGAAAVVDENLKGMGGVLGRWLVQEKAKEGCRWVTVAKPGSKARTTRSSFG